MGTPAGDAHRRAGRALVAGALGLGLLLFGRGASAAPAGAAAAQRVVVLRAPEDEALARQVATLLGAELKAAAFETIEIDRDPRAQPGAEVAAVWARLQPVAALVIVGARTAGEAGPAIDLWLEDPATRQRSARRIEVGAGLGAGAAATDLALKAVEILRGSLLEVTLAGAAAPPPPQADLEQRAVPVAEARSSSQFFGDGFGLSAGAGALAGTGVDSSVAPLLRLGWGAANGYGFRLAASGLGSVPQVRTDEGVARVRQALLLVDGLRAFRATARWQPVLSAGAGLYRVGADGTGISTLFPSGAGSSTAAALSAGVGLALRLGSRLALVGDVGLLWLSPTTKLRIGTRQAAALGGFSAMASLSLCARL